MFKMKKLLLATGLLAMTGAANAGYTIDLGDDNKLSFGGFIKIDARYVDGTVGYKDFWTGSGTPVADSSQLKLFANETRFNTKYVHGDVTGFIEMDFYGGGGNEVISNSVHPRLRHAFIKYKNVTVGQTWTTFMNTSALAETADFGGPMVGEAFVRNTQVRYTMGGLQVSLENPESYGGDPSQDSLPDVIAKYTFKGDWGNVSVAGLARQLNTTLGNTETGAGFSVAGRIKTFGKNDVRFQLHGGNTGRYVGVAAQKDLVGENAEESISYMAAYRHFWSESTRSSVFYGNISTDESDIDHSHYGVNIFTNVTKQLSFGAEVGQFVQDESDTDSLYLQFSAKYVL
ncbi:DcaP family trimeric outer membrane transporter [Colwellia sp. RSH04]|uniref:DcaP family trimeric outer membrane transporter n=1 Tax=Colwellia sp. RSH04 TaxID=2305464 RepID=UPI000E588B11|nr:DcaP family trimeric outer membrane transporter [Colwellia sp. RSH04]RHW76408.1 hypothetical protein D1094_08820 [Colwellia sp. RSH04]